MSVQNPVLITPAPAIKPVSGDNNGQGSVLTYGRGNESEGGGYGIGNGRGTGNGTGSGNTQQEKTTADQTIVQPNTRGITQNVRILSKPRAVYTDAARQNLVQGNVVLKVTFMANGQIGAVTPISGLGFGLTQQAIDAAKKIRFEPAMRNGKPYSKVATISYLFTIY